MYEEEGKEGERNIGREEGRVNEREGGSWRYGKKED